MLVHWQHIFAAYLVDQLYKLQGTDGQHGQESQTNYNGNYQCEKNNNKRMKALHNLK
jgi:hypothetical protein